MPFTKDGNTTAEQFVFTAGILSIAQHWFHSHPPEPLWPVQTLTPAAAPHSMGACGGQWSSPTVGQTYQQLCNLKRCIMTTINIVVDSFQLTTNFPSHKACSRGSQPNVYIAVRQNHWSWLCISKLWHYNCVIIYVATVYGSTSLKECHTKQQLVGI